MRREATEDEHPTSEPACTLHKNTAHLHMEIQQNKWRRQEALDGSDTKYDDLSQTTPMALGLLVVYDANKNDTH